MRYRVLPYKQGSKGAKALSIELGGKVLKLDGSSFVPKQGDVIINWGNGDPNRAHVHPAKFVQLPNASRNCSNKLFFFNMIKDAGLDVTPKFWTSKGDIPDDAYPIVCRTKLTGHSGDGIVIAATPDGLVDAPLYVEYKKKKEEYRVHCGKVPSAPCPKTIAVQRKARRLDCENPNWEVRSHDNGFVYVRGSVNPSPHVIEVAHKAFHASGLDFGAVDVIWNEHEGKAYVLEINTAPGLEGQTIKDYGDFFRSL